MKARLAVPALLAAVLALALGTSATHAAEAATSQPAASQPASAPATNASTGTVKGKVPASDTGNLSVMINPMRPGGQNARGTVNSDGTFEVTDVKPGTYMILIFNNSQHRPIAGWPNQSVTAGQTLDLTKVKSVIGSGPQPQHP